MKDLIIINGTMGAGKTATGKELVQRLAPAFFLDGDWCWSRTPFIVTEEKKAMVVENIAHLLNNFLKSSEGETVIFCWVMHQQAIIDNILNKLDLAQVRPHVFTLMPGSLALTERLTKDIQAGLREADIIPRSLERLACYEDMPTIKIDTSNITAKEAAEAIAVYLGK